MKKVAIVLIATMIIIVGFLCGCTSNNTSNQIKSPIVTVSANTYSGTAPLTVQFLGSYTNMNGPLDVYRWDFGDGFDSDVTNPSHTYSAQGIYTVTLTVGDDHGAKGNASLTITVFEGNRDESLHQMLIGTWDQNRVTTINGTPMSINGFSAVFTYYADGTMELDGNYYGHWRIEGGDLVMVSQATGRESYYSIEFYANGNGLKRTSENYILYATKQ